MGKVKLVAKPRQELGKRATRNLRREGFVPAVVYGHGMKSLSLAVESRELHHVLHTKAGENVVIDLRVDGVRLKKSTCLIKAIDHDPITDRISHVDFTVISMTEKISVKVPIVVENAEKSPGVKEGGVLDVIHYEIEVECLPTQIPEKIQVDLRDIKIGDTVHAGNLVIPEGVSIKLPPEESVITLHPPRKEEEVVPEVEEAVEPELIEKGKKAEVEEEAPGAPAEAEGAEKKEKKEKEKKEKEKKE